MERTEPRQLSRILRQSRQEVENRQQRARRRASKRQAFVIWANRREIKNIYAQARRLTESTGIRHQVDHTIPLKHPLVCGLHNEFNLRVITADENKRKHNHWDESLAQRQERLFA